MKIVFGKRIAFRRDDRTALRHVTSSKRAKRFIPRCFRRRRNAIRLCGDCLLLSFCLTPDTPERMDMDAVESIASRSRERGLGERGGAADVGK